MSNRHQELTSLEQTTSELASPKQTALGKDFSNPLIVDSSLKTIWLSMYHVITMKHWLFQSKRLLVCCDEKLKNFKITKKQKSSSSLKKVGLDLSRLATTLNRLERSIRLGSTWKHLDREFPSFANDPRNVCLGLATDGL
ncbi:hypothetical protein Tco_0924244 [Tanacetum coccineum]|uniref:Uncharacterized protein n=1 Tax=Tanacetum coccineum TaxID=301880 RepID=A0ABQ5D3D8_9ASTR